MSGDEPDDKPADDQSAALRGHPDEQLLSDAQSIRLDVSNKTKRSQQCKATITPPRPTIRN